MPLQQSSPSSSASLLPSLASAVTSQRPSSESKASSNSADEKTPPARPFFFPSPPPRTPRSPRSSKRTRRGADVGVDVTNSDSSGGEGDIDSELESSDGQRRAISAESLARWGVRESFVRTISAPAVLAATPAPPDSPPRSHDEDYRFGPLTQLGPPFDYPISPPPQVVDMRRRMSDISLVSVESSRSRSPASYRSKTPRGSNGGNLTLRLLNHHFKSEPSIAVQHQSVSSPSSSPLHERMSLSARSSPNASPWTIENTPAQASTRRHKKTSSASDSLGLALQGMRYPCPPDLPRRHSMPLDQLAIPPKSPSASSPTSSSSGPQTPPVPLPPIGDRSLSSPGSSLVKYLASGRRSSLPTPNQPDARSLDLPSPPLPSSATGRENSSTLLPPPSRKRDRSVTLQVASTNFNKLRTSLSTSVLNHLGRPSKSAPPTPIPVRFEDILAISVSFSPGDKRGMSANQFLLGLHKLQRSRGSRAWDPRLSETTTSEAFPEVSSTHGNEAQAPPVVVVRYRNGGKRQIYTETISRDEIMTSALVGPEP